MPTIRQLLDRYGLPPRELALDWAWQIRGLLDRGQLNSNECLLQPHVWTDMEVAATGQLMCEYLDYQSAHTALEDLSHWASSDSTCTPTDGISTAPAKPAEVSEIHVGGDTQLDEGIADSASTSCRPVRLRRSRLPIGGKLAWTLGGAFGLLIIAVLAWLGLSTSPETIAASSDQAANGLLPFHSDASDSDTDGLPAPSQLESLSLVDPNRQVDIDEAMPPTGTGTLAQLSVESSIGPPLSPSVAQEQSQTSDASPQVRDLTASPPSNEIPTGQAAAESMRDVKQTFQLAEAEETVVTADRNRASPHDTRGDPWVLSRDMMRYRVTLAAELKAKARDAQWSLALEPIDGLIIEPQRPVTIQPSGLAVWRIYEADAKPPRACLLVRAVSRGREGQLELLFCGGAEDMPGMSVPLATKWIEPLTVRVQSQALELRGALARLSTTVITPDQVPAAMQSKQAMLGQLFTSSRLGVIMPEINRLAQLVDGQVTMHAALKAKPDEPALATWGQLP